MTYRTSLDKTAKAITIGTTILFGIIIMGEVKIMQDSSKITPTITIILLSLIYCFTIAFRPINYQTKDNQLIIHGLFSDIKIDHQKIKSIDLLEKEDLRNTIRTFGVGGLFGYFGKFANRKLGNMTWYATRRENAVLVRTIDDKKIILTPDEPEKLIADFKI